MARAGHAIPARSKPRTVSAPAPHRHRPKFRALRSATKDVVPRARAAAAVAHRARSDGLRDHRCRWLAFALREHHDPLADETDLGRALHGPLGDVAPGDRSDLADLEIVSIMFEMKNEGEETATKKKNEDFLKELQLEEL